MAISSRVFKILVLTILLMSALPVQSGNIEKGKQKSEMCAGCHGADGISISSIIPNLAGQKEEYMLNSLLAFKSGERKNGIMSSVVTTISDLDAEDIAAYYSSLGGAKAEDKQD